MVANTTSLLIACGNPSHQPSFVQSRDGMTAYLGVVPRAVIVEHAPGHPERSMHAAEHVGDAHLTVAIYDNASGLPVEDALVDAVIRSDHPAAGYSLRLEPMRIENFVTYGGFVSLAPEDRYHVDLSIRRSTNGRATRLTFLFDAASISHVEKASE